MGRTCIRLGVPVADRRESRLRAEFCRERLLPCVERVGEPTSSSCARSAVSNRDSPASSPSVRMLLSVSAWYTRHCSIAIAYSRWRCPPAAH